MMEAIKQGGMDAVSMFNQDLGKCKLKQYYGFEMFSCLSESSLAVFTWKGDPSNGNYSF